MSILVVAACVALTVMVAIYTRALKVSIKVSFYYFISISRCSGAYFNAVLFKS
jgi:hypothetical protein